MRAVRSSVVAVSVFMVAVTGCGKAAEQPSESKDVEEPAKPATPEPAVEEPAVEEPAKPESKPEEPTKPAPEAEGASVHDGFSVGSPLATNQELEGIFDSEEVKSLSYAGATVTPSAHAVRDGEGKLRLFLRARVEFEGSATEQGLNHERPAAEAELELVFANLGEVAKLPDGRWIVDALLISAFGEDAVGTTTDHSVIVVDPANKSAAVVWTGADSTMNEFDACIRSGSYSFAVVGEELVVSATEWTKFDPEMAEEVGMTAAACEVQPEVTREVARIGLARK